MHKVFKMPAYFCMAFTIKGRWGMRECVEGGLHALRTGHDTVAGVAWYVGGTVATDASVNCVEENTCKKEDGRTDMGVCLACISPTHGMPVQRT